VTPDPRLASQHQHGTHQDNAGQPSDLEQAYRATAYCVDAPEGRLVIRIGQVHTAIDALLLRHGCRTWAYVTAHNPVSIRLQPEENQRRQRELEEEVARSGRAFYRGEASGTIGDWPAEQSVLILGVSARDALDLAEQYGQAALVFGAAGASAVLLWTIAGPI
jgi:Protein of unknown function (DUF3293)